MKNRNVRALGMFVLAFCAFSITASAQQTGMDREDSLNPDGLQGDYGSRRGVGNPYGRQEQYEMNLRDQEQNRQESPKQSGQPYGRWNQYGEQDLYRSRYGGQGNRYPQEEYRGPGRNMYRPRSYQRWPQFPGYGEDGRYGQSRGWVLVGVDYDQDGVVDSWEYISAEDFDNARRNSWRQQEMSGGPMGQDYDDDGGYMNGQPYGGQRMSGQPLTGRTAVETTRQQSVQGQVQDVRTFPMAAGQGDHLLARIETNDGRTTLVDFGRADRLTRLNLQRGDVITVSGISGMLNDRPVLSARRLEFYDRAYSLPPSQSPSLRRFRGEILSTRTRSFQGLDEEFLTAEVRLDDGRITTVNFGLQQSVQDIGLSEGRQISFLARPSRINDQPALLATQISIDGQQYNTRAPMSPPLVGQRHGGTRQSGYPMQPQPPPGRSDNQQQSRPTGRPPDSQSDEAQY